MSNNIKKQLGLIGYPLSHSFSKKYFSDKFERESIDGYNYELFPIEKIEGLKALVADDPKIVGLNVTIPYKEQVIPYLNRLSDAAKEIGAVNTIRFENGELTGHNTDVIGFENSIKPLLKEHHTKALILGTGGAAKAVEYVLKKLGIQFVYVSRRPLENGMTYNDISSEVIDEYKVIINTTPLGMYPNIEESPKLPYEALSSDHLLYDLVYNPEVTAFMKQGKERGAGVKNGLEMLIGQAEAAWKIWND